MQGGPIHDCPGTQGLTPFEAAPHQARPELFKHAWCAPASSQAAIVLLHGASQKMDVTCTRLKVLALCSRLLSLSPWPLLCCRVTEGRQLIWQTMLVSQALMLAFLAHSHLFSGCTSLLSCRQVRRPFPPPVQRKALRLAFMQTLSAARPDSRCAAARLPSAYNNSVVMISLMVFCSRRPSVRNAGLDLSLPMKIKVGSPCICTQSPA